eukprot:938936-Ditylum_brightwellii.AAC.1
MILELRKYQYGYPNDKSKIPMTEQVDSLDDKIRSLCEQLHSLQQDKSTLLAKHKHLLKVSSSTKIVHILYNEAICGKSSKNGRAGDEGKLKNNVTVKILDNASGVIMGTK